jgi:hypothetical protein
MMYRTEPSGVLCIDQQGEMVDMLAWMIMLSIGSDLVR